MFHSEVLIERHWKGRVKRTVCETFWELYQKAPSKFELEPVISTSKFYLIHVTRNDLFYLTVVSADVSPLFVLEAQQKIVNTLVEYLREPTETTIRENFTIVYQLLDEMVDGGFPFTVELNQLTEMIVPPSMTNRVLSALGSSGTTVRDELSGAALSKTPWRKADVKYLTNEIYFDLIEHVDMVVNANEQTVACSVAGEVKCRCLLSGVPDLSLTFKGAADALDDVSLHRCIRISRYQKERVFSFVPPDGAFTLFTYRARENVRSPLYVKPAFTWLKTSCRFSVQVGLKHDAQHPVADITVTIPLPRGVLASSVTANLGSVSVDQLTKTCKWTIPKLGPKDALVPVLEGSLTLSPDAPLEERPVIRVGFEAVKFSATGMAVDGLVVRNVRYTPVRGFRVVTKAGKYQVRVA